MLIPFQDIFVPQNELGTGSREVTAPTAGLARFRSIAGSIKTLDISVDFAVSNDATFNLRINGVPQFSGASRPKILATTKHISKTGLSIAVSDDDTLDFDLEVVGSGGVPWPIYFRCEIETAQGDTECLMFAVSDESTALTTGTAKLTFRMPYAFQLSEVRSSINTVSSSGLVTVDINEGGATILSTKLSIDASEKTSVTAATPVVISDPDLADDAEMTIDIDAAGTGAKGLKVTLIGKRV